MITQSSQADPSQDKCPSRAIRENQDSKTVVNGQKKTPKIRNVEEKEKMR